MVLLKKLEIVSTTGKHLKHVIKSTQQLSIAVLALCSLSAYLCDFLPDELQLLGFLDEENLYELCAWGSQKALIQ